MKHILLLLYVTLVSLILQSQCTILSGNFEVFLIYFSGLVRLVVWDILQKVRDRIHLVCTIWILLPGFIVLLLFYFSIYNIFSFCNCNELINGFPGIMWALHISKTPVAKLASIFCEWAMRGGLLNHIYHIYSTISWAIFIQIKTEVN